MSEQYDLLKSILLEKSVRTGTFTLASGKVSDLYVDCRMTALDPVGATLVGALGWKLVQEEILPRFPEVAAIGGMTMGAENFLQAKTLMIIAMGVVAFGFSTAGGVLLAKLMNKLSPDNPINPLIGSAGVWP